MALIQRDYFFENIHLKFWSFIHPESGELWVTANDIARSLGYCSPSDAIYDNIHNVTFKTKWTNLIQGLGFVPIPSNWQQNTMMINEGGVNRLVLGCRLGGIINKIKDWICSEVLPSIRKHGAYVRPDVTSDQISNLIKMLEEKERQVQAVRVKLDETYEKLYESHQEILASNNRNRELCNKILHIRPRIAVMPYRKNLQHTIRVYKHVSEHEYVFIRPQERNLHSAIKQVTMDGYDLIFKREQVPNAVNILNKIKEKLDAIGIEYTARNNTIKFDHAINLSVCLQQVCTE